MKSLSEIVTREGETEQGVRLGTRLGDLLCGTYPLADLNHENKVVLLVDLVELFNCVQTMGWHEHTGDWDWTVEFTMTNGSTFPTSEDGHCMDFEIVWPEDDEGLHTACVRSEKVTYVNVPYVVGDVDKEAKVLIDDIVSVGLYY